MGLQYCCCVMLQLKISYIIQNRTFQQIPFPFLTSNKRKKRSEKMKMFSEGKPWKLWLWLWVFSVSLFFFVFFFPQTTNRKIIKEIFFTNLHLSWFFLYLSLKVFIVLVKITISFSLAFSSLRMNHCNNCSNVWTQENKQKNTPKTRATKNQNKIKHKKNPTKPPPKRITTSTPPKNKSINKQSNNPKKQKPDVTYISCYTLVLCFSGIYVEYVSIILCAPCTSCYSSYSIIWKTVFFKKISKMKMYLTDWSCLLLWLLSLLLSPT